MKKLRVIPFVIAGGVLGFSVHLIWHSIKGVNLFSIGIHAIQGTIYTLVGMIIGGIIYLLFQKM